MRILFVLEHFYPYIGGVETLFLELSRALVDQGHHVEVVTTRFRRDLPGVEEVEGVHIYRVRCFNRFLFSFLSIPKVIARARHCDLVQTTSYNAALPAWLGACMVRKPIVITFHEVWGRLWGALPFIPRLLRYAYRGWEWLILRLPYHRMIAVSDATRHSLVRSGIPPDRVRRIYNGLDYGQFPHDAWQPPGEFVYTYFGRLGASKGLDLLLPAASVISKKYPQSRFKLIIPRYPAGIFRDVMSLISAEKLEHHVTLYHDLPRSQLFEEVRTSSCVVVPSYSEGFCFVAAEAVAWGVPVLSSQKSALAEVVGGQYIEINPLSKDGIIRALEKAILGQWQYKPHTRFPLQASVIQYIHMYEALLNP